MNFKSIKRLWTPLALICLILIFHSCAGNNTDKKELKKIAKERKQTQKSISDIGDAVIATDEQAWDSANDYKRFRELSTIRLDANKHNIDAFVEEVSWNGKIPIIYRRRLKKLDAADSMLTLRLHNYNLYGKPNWDDFKELFDYDLKKVEDKIKKLTDRQK